MAYVEILRSTCFKANPGATEHNSLLNACAPDETGERKLAIRIGSSSC